MKNVFKLPVHPLAASFPMLIESELQELADDIKANGLSHPILVAKIDNKDTLIDGRNRLAACKLAGVEPEIKMLNGEDVVAQIVSENLMRRNLTKSQQAMLMAYSNPDGGQGKSTSSRNRTKLGHGIQSKARAINHEAKDLADAIVTGTISVEKAYDQMIARRAPTGKDSPLYIELCENAPELAEMVDKGDDLHKMYAVYIDRKENERKAREVSFDNLLIVLHWFTSMDKKPNRENMLALINDHADELKRITSFTPKKCIDTLETGHQSLTKLLEESDE